VVARTERSVSGIGGRNPFGVREVVEHAIDEVERGKPGPRPTPGWLRHALGKAQGTAGNEGQEELSGYLFDLTAGTMEWQDDAPPRGAAIAVAVALERVIAPDFSAALVEVLREARTLAIGIELERARRAFSESRAELEAVPRPPWLQAVERMAGRLERARHHARVTAESAALLPGLRERALGVLEQLERHRGDELMEALRAELATGGLPVVLTDDLQHLVDLWTKIAEGKLE
jgi:hypothetical protein